MLKKITKEKMAQQIEAVKKFADIMGYTIAEYTSSDGKILYIDLQGTYDSEYNEYGWCWYFEENGYSGPYSANE